VALLAQPRPYNALAACLFADGIPLSSAICLYNAANDPEPMRFL
jgi:hypothetical protein